MIIKVTEKCLTVEARLVDDDCCLLIQKNDCIEMDKSQCRYLVAYLQKWIDGGVE